MLPKNTERPQSELFQSRLDQILNPRHPLFKLAHSIDWTHFENAFGPLYCPGIGRPGLPTRLMVALHYLKHAYSESDESVVARLLENPYWQYFSGFEFFKHSLPLDASSMTNWRKRIKPEGVEEMLAQLLTVATGAKLLKPSELRSAIADTTVSEKAIAFPTDTRLYEKMRRALAKTARGLGIKLRQSYDRLGKLALQKQGRYAHAKQMRRAAKETRKSRSYLGRVYRDIQRKAGEMDGELGRLMGLAQRLLQQKRDSKGKLYSIHEPEVDCISKGKAHKRYEFGSKVSVVSTLDTNWVIGVDALKGNPYDGHTLKGALEQVLRLTVRMPEEVYCDKGYKGAEKTIEGVTVHLPKSGKKLKQSIRRRQKRRSAIEPIIGHLKADHRMGRSCLKGIEGDRINAILAACGFNLRKLLRAFFGQRFWELLSRYLGFWNQYRLQECYMPSA